MSEEGLDHPLGLFPRATLGLKDFGQYFSHEFIARFYATIHSNPETKQFIDRLSAEEFDDLKHRQADHLIQLSDPACGVDALRNAAMHVGRIHSMIGLDVSTLSQAYKLQVDLIGQGVNRYFPLKGDRDLVRLFLYERILEDLVGQMASMQKISQEQVEVLHDIEETLRTTKPLADILRTVFDLVMTVSGMRAVALTRPDDDGVLRVEKYSGDLIRHYLEAMQTGLAHSSSVRDAYVRDPYERAWHSGESVLIDSYETGMLAPWRVALARDHHVRSAAILPIMDAKDHVQALFQLYHTMPGYFSASERQSFLSRLQGILSTVLSPTLTDQPVILHQQRQDWRALLEHDGLIMYFQPIADLKTMKIHKVEALARLRDSGGRLILPGDFLPAFGQRELQILFTQGLYQALKARRRWEAQGLAVGISINFPTEGIGYPVYWREIQKALAATQTAPSNLTVELLETEDNAARSVEQWMGDLARLGVRLAQDDLGSGYSSLLRLGRVAFDEVKVDQGLVRGSRHDPRKALEFIHHLTGLGHDFGIAVTIEGVEHLGLIEAAAILGADYGQGYGIARPMPADELAAWARQFQLNVEVMQPRTALGAFAASMLWQMQLRALTPLPDLLRYFVKAPCPVSHYIHSQGLEETDLAHTLQALYVAALQGAGDPQYRQVRRHMEQLLADRAQVEASATM
ncbi:MAG: EAL domain-containing protein [Firmicutes bacterium]|nr:EAL domain-containing protein [Bacillota bacterium]